MIALQMRGVAPMAVEMPSPSAPVLSPDELPRPEIDPAPSPLEIPATPPVTTPVPSPPPPITDRPAAPVRGGPWCAFAAVAFLASPVHGFAQPAVSAADRHFMDEATKGGMAEIVLGRVAQEKATNDAVRLFGVHMVEDHNKANEELKQIAAAKSVQLPTGLTSDQKALVSRMRKIKGTGFDRTYMAQMLADHRKTIALFEQASTSATDPEAKAFASKALPTLRSHLDMAQQAERAVATAPKGKPAMQRE